MAKPKAQREVTLPAKLTRKEFEDKLVWDYFFKSNDADIRRLRDAATLLIRTAYNQKIKRAWEDYNEAQLG